MTCLDSGRTKQKIKIGNLCAARGKHGRVEKTFGVIFGPNCCLNPPFGNTIPLLTPKLSERLKIKGAATKFTNQQSISMKTHPVSNFLPSFGSNIERQSPLWRCDAYNTLQSYGTINDFLADYRHESCDILSFLSCLEESEIASNDKGIDLEDPRSKMVLTSAEHAWSQHLSSLCPTSAVGTFGKEQATFTYEFRLQK